MKSYRKELTFNTKTRRAYVNITPRVETALAESGIREGLCLVNAMNITASVFINDNESGLHRDFERWLEKLAPEKPHSQYDYNGYEDNADAHMKRSVMIDEQQVNCVDPQWQFRFKTGYEPKEKDIHDVRALCGKFGFELPKKYVDE